MYLPMRVLFLIFTLSFLLPFLALDPRLMAQAGSFDPGFGANGKAAFHLNEHYNNSTAIAVQPDGKILMAGSAGTGNPDYSLVALVRLLPDGSLDATFGVDGKVFTNAGLLFSLAFVTDLLIQSDGKIVVIGSASTLNSPFNTFLIRFHPDGAIDNTFGTNGKRILHDCDGAINNARLQPDDKVVITGVSTSASSQLDIVVHRLLPNGQPDSSFGTGGVVVTNLGTTNDAGYAPAILPDGKILIAGHKNEELYSIATDFVLVRYLPDGSLDDAFGEGGVAVHSFSSVQDDALDLLVMPDDKILLTGYFQGDAGNYDFTLVRCLPNGALDTAFGNGGILLLDLGSQYDLSRYCIRQPDGKILLAGTTDIATWEPRPAIVRLNADFTLDSTFGSNGVLKAGVDDLINDVYSLTHYALQPDGNLVFCAESVTDPEGNFVFCAFRVLTGLNLSALHFSKNSVNDYLLYPNPVQSESVLRYTLERDEKLTLGLYDLNGCLLQTFLNNTARTAGEHQETLHFAPALPAGHYLLRIDNGEGHTGIQLIKQ